MVKRNLVVGLAAAVMSCGLALGDSFTPWRLQQVGLIGQVVNVSYNKGATSINYNNDAGLIQMKSLNNAGLYPAGTVFDAFCADVGVALLSVGNYEVVYPVEWPAVNGVSPKWVEGGWERASWLVKNIPFSGNTADMAGLQVAIWEALYDEDLDLNSGSFVLNGATPAATAAANDYVALLAASNQNSKAAYVRPVRESRGQWVPANNQGLIVPVPDGGLTLLLLGLGFGGMALMQRVSRRS